MIKATGRIGDDTLLLFGLSRQNCERLLRGQPIRVHGLDIGVPGVQIIIMAGESEEAIQHEMAATGAISEDTAVIRLNP